MSRLGLEISLLSNDNLFDRLEIEWQDQYCQNWENISSMEWQRYYSTSCTKIWAKLIYNKWNEQTSNWETIKEE